MKKFDFTKINLDEVLKGACRVLKNEAAERDPEDIVGSHEFDLCYEYCVYFDYNERGADGELCGLDVVVEAEGWYSEDDGDYWTPGGEEAGFDITLLKLTARTAIDGDVVAYWEGTVNEARAAAIVAAAEQKGDAA